MTTEQLYKKAERADDIGDVDLTDADMGEIAQHVYDAWFSRVKENLNPSYTDSSRSKAIQMLEPFREKLKGEFNTSKMCFTNGTVDDKTDDNVSMAVQIYLSALVEGTDISKLVVGKHALPRSLVDIRMPRMKGKTVEISPEGSVWYANIGEGTLLNRGKMNEAVSYGNSTYINFGEAWFFGAHDDGCLFINYGEAQGIGYKCKGGIFLNFGKAGKGDETAVGYRCSGGVFVTKTEPVGGFLVKPEGPVYGVGPEELEKDRELSGLMDEIEAIGKVPDVPKANELARKIDAHVRANYKRKIA